MISAPPLSFSGCRMDKTKSYIVKVGADTLHWTEDEVKRAIESVSRYGFYIKVLSIKEVDSIEKSETIFSISEEEVWQLAEREGIKIPEDKKDQALYYVKKYLEGYCFDSSYTIWDAVKDAIKDALTE